MPESPFWKIDRFLDAVDRWKAVDKPTTDLAFLVTEWTMTRFDDPYQGASRVREHGFENMWKVKIPGTEDGKGRAIHCFFWIDESTRTVVCDSIATLAMPV